MEFALTARKKNIISEGGASEKFKNLPQPYFRPRSYPCMSTNIPSISCLSPFKSQYLPSLLLIDAAFMYMLTNLSATDLIYLQNKIIAESLENFQLEL
jgi:hypothetical protein